MPLVITQEQQRIIDFLKSQDVAVLATVDQSGQPHAAAVYYTFDQNSMNFFFITKRETEKNRNLEHNDKVALTIYQSDIQATVQIKGSVVQEREPDKVESIFRSIWQAAMATSNRQAPPLTKIHAGAYVVYRLIPSSVRMASFVRKDTDTSDQIFEDIS